MTIEDIKRIIQGDETRTLELKKTTGELKAAMHSACAFLNTDGGWLVFGVAPASLKILGQQVTDNTRREIAHELTRIEPAIDIQAEYVDVPEKEGYQVVALHFNGWERGMVPYTYDNRPYYRVESTTKPMPRAMFEERLRDSNPGFYSWEEQEAEIGMDELDDEMIMNTVRGGVRGNRMSETALNDTKENILVKFSLLQGGRLLNAAAVLFVRNNLRYPQLKLRMARFKGSGKNMFGDNMLAEGNMFRLLDAGMAFFFKHLNLSGRVEGLKRTEELEIPYIALREALTNALGHRRYDQPGTSAGIAIYDDRVEIENPGVFPKGITPETIKMPHASHPYNPRIANVLFLSTYLEQWGSGVGRIIEACKAQNVDEPVYEERGGFITLVFRRPFYGNGNVAQNVVQNVAQKTSARGRQIIELIRRNDGITRAEMAESLGVSKKTVEREIEKMKEILKYVGSSKDGRWVLNLKSDDL